MRIVLAKIPCQRQAVVFGSMPAEPPKKVLSVDYFKSILWFLIRYAAKKLLNLGLVGHIAVPQYIFWNWERVGSLRFSQNLLPIKRGFLK